ncbi:MAG: hypothetical protein PHV59_09310, partial [Victivallales bacterium]|nr:hypothetical protein [Victivallales bacterium]
QETVKMADDLTVIKRYPVAVAFGADAIGPSEEPPEITFENETYESKVQANGGVMPAAKIVTLKRAKITIDTKNIAWAMAALAALAEGADVYAAANSKALTLVPITSGTEKTLTFPNAFLEPDSDYKPPANKDHSMKLTFTAFVDDNGALFTYA